MEVRQIGNIMPTKSRDNPNQGRVYSVDGLCPALTKMDGGGRQPMIIGNVHPSGNGINGNVHNSDGLAPTVTTNKGEGAKVCIKQATAKGYIECEVGGWQICHTQQAQHEEGEYRIWVE